MMTWWTRKNSNISMHQDYNSESDQEQEEDFTCCHRITLFSPLIREILITEPILKCIGLGGVTWARLFMTTTYMGTTLIVWALLYFLLDEVMLPNNSGFGFYVLIISSCLLGRFVSSIPRLNLPPVFGMLLAGVLVRNTGLYNIDENLGEINTAKIRTFCLSFIAIRAGLQLSITSIKENTILLLVLALLPCTVEVFIVTLSCRYLLSYPWDWSYMSGTILACMSPVVTVNCILALAERGYGEDKGLATILCSAACIDNVHVVSLFAVSYSNVFTNGIQFLIRNDCYIFLYTCAIHRERTEWWSYVPSGFRDAILAIIAGTIIGTFFVFFPHRSYKYATGYRIISLALGSVMCTAAAAKIAISSGGFIACVVLSFVAITGWKLLSETFVTRPYRNAAAILWQMMQPILVGVIGADINLNDWNLTRFGLHLLCILIGLTARSLTVLAVVTVGNRFTWKERLLIMFAWLPKGTLQAALGPMAFEHVRRQQDDKLIDMALDLLRMSFLTMLILAPIGAILINLTGPVLLNKATFEQQRKSRQLSYIRTLSLQRRKKRNNPRVLNEPTLRTIA